MAWEPTDEQVERAGDAYSGTAGSMRTAMRAALVAAVGPEIDKLNEAIAFGNVTRDILMQRCDAYQAELSLLRTQHEVLANAVADGQQRALIERERAAAHRDDLETRDTQPPPKSEG